MVETRPGTVRYYDSLPSFAMSLATFKGRIFGHHNSNRLFATAIDNTIDGAFIDIAELTPPDSGDPSTRVRFQEAAKNLYMTSSLGVRRCDDGTALAPAGAPKALVLVPASGFVVALNIDKDARRIWRAATASASS